MRFIGIDQAKPGMDIGKTIYDEGGRVLVNYRVKLTAGLIDRMKKLGLSGFYIDDEFSKDIDIQPLLDEKLERRAFQVLHDMDVDAALDVASEITEELCQSSDISVNLIGLRTDSDYTYKHSVSVASLSVLIGLRLGLNKNMLRETASAGLLHDIGKPQMPKEILNKPGPLIDEEYELVKTHSQKGYEILRDNIAISSKVKMGVYMHHENMNGTGYPTGASGDQIYQLARIIHVADVYDAMTNRRPYRRALPPSAALDYLNANAGKLFDRECVKAFVNYIPLYPKGRNVILSDGDVAVVVENRKKHTQYPIVRRLSDGHLVDLSHYAEEDLKIIGFEKV